MNVLRQSTQRVVRIGPFVDATDGVTPETGVTLGAADQAEALKAAGAATADISAATFAAVTGADGWYDLTLTTSHTDTVGDLTIVVQDSSVCLPVVVRFTVVEEAVYDSLFAASAGGYLAPTTAGRTLDVTAGGCAGVDWANVEAPTTTLALTGTTIATTQKVDLETIKTQSVTCGAGVTVRADVGAAAAPGAANGMLIGGANAATTFATLTSTGAFTCGSTVLGNTTMGTLTQTGAVSWGATTFASLVVSGTTTLTGAVGTGAITAASITSTGAFSISDGLIITASTGNRSAISATGNGSGHGVAATGGATGNGMKLLGGGTSGAGFDIRSQGGTGAANYAMYVLGGGSSDSGGIWCGATTDGDGLECKAAGTDRHGLYVVGASGGEGLHATGGSGNTGHGALFEAGSGATNGCGFVCTGVGTGTSHGALFTRGSAAGDDMKFTNGDVTIGTVTTVTNQLTAAQIATGVWQDATGTDFTTASSIGKALYINNVAPGGSGGLLISGSNSGTTTFANLTVTGSLTTGTMTNTNTALGITTIGTLTQTGAASLGVGSTVTFATLAVTGALSVGTTTTLTGDVTHSGKTILTGEVRITDQTTALSLGKYLADILGYTDCLPATWVIPLDAAGTATAVWNAATASYGTSGTYGEALEAVGAAADPWLTNLPGSYLAGTAGYIIGNTVAATTVNITTQTTTIESE